eukprot:scaffold22949_cov69-Phaeocystis_antarctica.AAC.2
MTRPGKAVDNRVSLLGAGASNSSLLPAPSVAEAQGSGGGDDRMRVVQEQVDGVKSVMQQNVNQMVNNMDKTQHLETTTQELVRLTRTRTPNPNPNPNLNPSPNPDANPDANTDQADTAKSFHKTAVKARRHFWLQNLKFKAAVGQHGQSAPWAVAQLGSCAFSGHAWWLRLLEPAASKAAHSPRLTIQVGGALLIGLIIILAASGAFNGGGGDDGDGGGGDGGGNGGDGDGGGGGGDGGGGGGGRRLLFGA